ncbi:MAG: hypothetical protein ACRDLN_17740 [Solirubrobacteraceae bacterium]
MVKTHTRLMSIAALALAAPAAAGAMSLGSPASASAKGCTVGTIVVRATALEPRRTGVAGITFRGEVRTTKDFCGDQAKIIGERKVCGAFGCNYHTVRESGWKPVEATSLDLSIEGPCKGGRHRYRTRVLYQAPQPLTPPPGRVVTHQRESDNLDCPE